MPKISCHLGDVRTILKKEKPSSIRIVTSKNIASKLSWALREMGISRSQIIYIPDGEKAKEWDVLKELLRELSRAKLDRSSIVIAFGGGTIGDLVGFAASIYLRGIRYIQIPTTLVSQVDSAHGGKTGIDFLGTKNQIGSFYEPLAIIADIRFIRSLGKDQIVDGLGEIIKCGLIKDPSILALLKKEHISTIVISRHLKSLIMKTIQVKSFYTNTDRKDGAERQMLNFGHTYGHAVEFAYKVSHGYAVIVGMLYEIAFAESLRLTPLSVRKNLANLLDQLGIHIDRKYKADARRMMHDKKMIGGSIILPIIEKEGRSKLVKIDAKKLGRLSKTTI